MVNEQSQNGRVEYQIEEITCGVTLNAHICVQGGRGLKNGLRYVRAKWMAPNKFCGIFFVYWSGQLH